MYLCIGSLLKLIIKYRTAGNSNEEICNLICSFVEKKREVNEDKKNKKEYKYEYSPKEVNHLINCDINIKNRDRNFILNFNLQNDRNYNNLHDILEQNANYILRDVLPLDNIGPFVHSLLTIIQSDDEICSADNMQKNPNKKSNAQFGMNPEYTIDYVLNNSKTFDVTEFLINILYYCYTLKDNRKGKDTVVNCLTDSFIEEQSFAANNIFIRSINGDNRYTYRRNCSDDELPSNLTPTATVINKSFTDILFRESEVESIINSIKSNKSKNFYLYGMGGCGKTSIARIIYSRLQNTYDCYGWINYSGNIKQSMIDAIILDEYSDETMTEYDSEKKWYTIQRNLTDSKQSKLFVIDNVDYINQIQDPRTDEDLISMSNWPNTTIIITSRIASITGYTAERVLINNLGDKNNDKKCIELFYHYNQTATSNRNTNQIAVAKLCALAGYNTMVIELLAKGSYYYGDDLDEFYQELLKNNFSCANDTSVSTDHDFTKIRTAETNNYYDIGNETVATQIYKLFNMKTRSELEQLILWDFHCLKENEKVTRKELKDWIGYEPKDLNRLRDEGWIKFQDGLFFIHPLVNQAISCSDQNWNKYWDCAETRRQTEKNPSLISRIKSSDLFVDSDSFDIKIRKLYFANYLSYEGRFLEPENLIYLADNARRIGTRDLGLKFYKSAYDKLVITIQENDLVRNSHLPESNKDNIFGSELLLRACCEAYPFIKCQADEIVEFLPTAEQMNLLKLFWKCCYFYGYMLSYTAVGMKDAKEYLSLSMIIIRQLHKYYNNNEEYTNYYGRNLDHLAFVISRSDIYDTNMLSIAYKFYSEALVIRQNMASAHPTNMEYQRNLAWTMDNLGVFLTDFLTDGEYTNHRDDLYLNPDHFEDGDNHPAAKLQKEFLEKKLVDAENLLRESLSIRKKIAETNGDTTNTEVAWTDVSMTRLLMNFDDKLDEAEPYILDALNIYNELDKLYPAQHASSQAKAYKIYGGLLMRKKQISEALKAYKTAHSIYEKLDHDFPGVYSTELELLQLLITATNKEF